MLDPLRSCIVLWSGILGPLWSGILGPLWSGILGPLLLRGLWGGRRCRGLGGSWSHGRWRGSRDAGHGSGRGRRCSRNRRRGSSCVDPICISLRGRGRQGHGSGCTDPICIDHTPLRGWGWWGHRGGDGDIIL